MKRKRLFSAMKEGYWTIAPFEGDGGPYYLYKKQEDGTILVAGELIGPCASRELVRKQNERLGKIEEELRFILTA